MIRTLAVIALVWGCSKKADEARPAPAASATKSAAKPPLTAAWFGKVVAPPGELAKIKLGIPAAEAKKSSPIATEPGLVDSELADVYYGAQSDLAGKITDTLIEMPVADKAMLEQAWGAGQDADRGGHPVVVWFNPDTGVRAVFSDEGKGRAYVRFEPYVPLAKLLGDGPGIAALAKPFAGQTKEELAKTYPEYMASDGRFELPATEWEFGGEIPLSPYPLDGKIESLAFSISYNTKGKGKAEVMDVITKKWGAAKGKVEFEEGAEIYNQAKPHIEVSSGGTYSNNDVTIRIGK